MILLFLYLFENPTYNEAYVITFNGGLFCSWGIHVRYSYAAGRSPEFAFTS